MRAGRFRVEVTHHLDVDTCQLLQLLHGLFDRHEVRTKLTRTLVHGGVGCLPVHPLILLGVDGPDLQVCGDLPRVGDQLVVQIRAHTETLL